MKRIQIFLLFLLMSACSASPARGPASVRIDPAFTNEEATQIYDAIDEWSEALSLTTVVSTWEDPNAVPIARDDALIETIHLGQTHEETEFPERDWIHLPGAGTYANGNALTVFDFREIALHEFGHLLGLNFGGADGSGHSGDPADVMFAIGAPGEHKHLTANDVARANAVVGTVW